MSPPVKQTENIGDPVENHYGQQDSNNGEKKGIVLVPPKFGTRIKGPGQKGILRIEQHRPPVSPSNGPLTQLQKAKHKMYH